MQLTRRGFAFGLGTSIGSPLYAFPSRRAAFVLGISDYRSARDLATPNGDSANIASVLGSLGFQTVLRQNLNRSEIFEEFARFRWVASTADLVVVYIASHGFFAEGESYVVASDATGAGQAMEAAVPVSALRWMVSDRPRQKVFLLDTCRDKPLSRPPRIPMAQRSTAGEFTCFAAQPGEVAFDDIDGQSPFARALLGGLERPGLDMAELSRFIRLHTLAQTDGQQVPWSVSTLLAPVVLNRNGSG